MNCTFLALPFTFTTVELSVVCSQLRGIEHMADQCKFQFLVGVLLVLFPV